jgi:hypothetical protein
VVVVGDGVVGDGVAEISVTIYAKKNRLIILRIDF